MEKDNIEISKNELLKVKKKVFEEYINGLHKEADKTTKDIYDQMDKVKFDYTKIPDSSDKGEKVGRKHK